MSLQTLPAEALAHIAAHLSHSDRQSLSLAHASLLKHFHPLSSFHADVHRLRFSTRRHTPPCPAGTPPFSRLVLHDVVDDLCIHSALPFRRLTPPAATAPAPPLVAHTPTTLFVATGRTLSVFRRARRRHGGLALCARHALPAVATALQASPSSDTLLLGLSNHAAALYTAPPNPTFSPPIRGHRAPLSAVLLHNQILLTASHDATIRVRHAATRRNHATLRGHGGPIPWLAAAGSPHTVLSHGGDDARVKLWDVERAICISTGRPGAAVAHAVADASGVVYAALARRAAVAVLDPRLGLDATAAVLSLPRASVWHRAAGIAALHLSRDGRLAAAVGGGGVAVWDPAGPWEARALGWPRRWADSDRKRLAAVLVRGRGVVAGGDARELLTFSLDGAYQGLVMEDGVKRAGVACLADLGDDGFVVGRADGRVDLALVSDGKGDWEAARRLLEEGSHGTPRFWENPRQGDALGDAGLDSGEKR